MKFMVLNRDKIENFNITEKHIVISIRDPSAKKPKLPKLSARVGTLFLSFSDVDEKVHPSTKLITKTDAKKILKFFNKYRKKVELVICQCEAGICRSSAIAGALSKIVGQDDSVYFKKFLPNKLVYRTILNTYYE